MKAKLIKDNEGYHLKSQIKDIPKGINVYNKINDNEGLFGFGGHTGKLSIKNCEAIANGYDLDELADEHCNKLYHEGNINWDRYRIHFKLGFQKALEILGDKKFSEDDLRLAMHFGKFGETNNQTTTIGFIKSLQQTEWDVEIEMGCKGGCKYLVLNGTNSICCGDKIPKLDSEGCLILKRL